MALFFLFVFFGPNKDLKPPGRITFRLEEKNSNADVDKDADVASQQSRGVDAGATAAKSTNSDRPQWMFWMCQPEMDMVASICWGYPQEEDGMPVVVRTFDAEGSPVPSRARATSAHVA